MIKLIIFDVGGVFRDTSKALNEGYRRGFESLGLPYSFKAVDTWHLRGLEKYHNAVSCIKVMLVLQRAGRSLGEILNHKDAEKILDGIVSEHSDAADKTRAEKIYAIRKVFFNSEEAKPLIKVYPEAPGVMESLKRKGYMLAIFTNSSMATVNRDLAYVGLEKFSAILDENMVTHKKPSGEGIIKVMEMLHASREDTCYVGDTASDIAAARDAGCKSVAVLSGMGLKMHLEMEKPDHIFKDIVEMRDYFVSHSL